MGAALTTTMVIFASSAFAFDPRYDGGRMMDPANTESGYVTPGGMGPGYMDPAYAGPGYVDPGNMPGSAYSGEHHFQLGFAMMANQMPHIVGQPLENERYGPNGDSLQQTTTGLMVWRQADNWTAFTDGNHTWVSGPYGIQMRLNHERFGWEAQ